MSDETQVNGTDETDAAAVEVTETEQSETITVQDAVDAEDQPNR